MFDISCVGILTADVLAKPIEELPQKGLLSNINQIQLLLGGCASNAAIDLTKLGAKVQLFGKIGQDNLGGFVKNEVKSAGVDVSQLGVSESVQTSASVVAISNDGERSVMHCIGANAEFCFKDIDLDRITQSKVLFIAGTFLMPGFDGEGACKLLRAARKAGVLCCLDTAWDSAGIWMKKLGVCMPYIDWFMPSYEEAVELSGKRKPEEIAEVFLKLGAGNVIVKLGEKGCYVKPGNKDGFFENAYDSIEVVDTSGAGDSFCAGFIMGLIQGWDLRNCARFANAVGSFCIAAIGTTTGIKSKEEVLTFMKENKQRT